MNKPLGRRAFLKAAAAAPIAAKSATQQLAAKVGALETAAALQATGLSMGMAAPAGHGVYQLIHDDRLWALHQVGLLPDWAREDVESETRREARWHIEPSLWSLKSVSPAAKAAIQSQRSVDKTWKEAAAMRARNVARRAFFDSNRIGSTERKA